MDHPSCQALGPEPAAGALTLGGEATTEWMSGRPETTIGFPLRWGLACCSTEANSPAASGSGGGRSVQSSSPTSRNRPEWARSLRTSSRSGSKMRARPPASLQRLTCRARRQMANGSMVSIPDKSNSGLGNPLSHLGSNQLKVPTLSFVCGPSHAIFYPQLSLRQLEPLRLPWLGHKH